MRNKCSTEHGSLFYNYKQFFLVSKGVVDSESRFIFIDIGAYGKQSDGGTFSASTSCHFSEDFESVLPMPASLEGSGRELSFVILGNNASPLKTSLMNLSRERVCHVKNVFSTADCREQRDALSVPLVP